MAKEAQAGDAGDSNINLLGDAPQGVEQTSDTTSAEEGVSDPVAEAETPVPEEPNVLAAPRDERHDSIDAGGVLTDEAVQLRAERGITQAGLQAGDGDGDEPEGRAAHEAE